MKTFQIVQTRVEETNFDGFEKVIQNIYPKERLASKQFEGMNTENLHTVYFAMQNSKPVGRCCLYSNPALEYLGYKTVCIGNFECIENASLAKTLLEKAEQEARRIGAGYIVGPMNGSIWESYRFGVNNSYANFFLEPYYPDYYPHFFLENGFETLARYVSNIDKNQNLADKRIIDVETRFEAAGVTFRTIDTNRFEEELDKLHDFCLESFRKNFLFTPISKARFVEKYLKVKPYINSNYVLIAQDKNEKIVGFIFCIENFNDKQERGLIVKTLAKDPSMRYGGLGNVLVTRVKRKALSQGVSYFIHAFMMETNASKSLSQHFSAQLLREYYLYGKKI